MTVILDAWMDDRSDIEKQHDALYWPIADAIATSNKTVTQELVRQGAGGGSYSYIGPSVKRWRKKPKPSTLRAAAEEIPAEVKAAQDQANEIAWRAAINRANERIQRIEAATQERLKEVEVDELDLRKEVSRLEDELKMRDATIKQRDQEILTLMNKVEELGKLLAGAQATIESEQSHSKQLQTRIDEITQDLMTAQAESGKWKEQAENLAGQLTDSESKLKDANDAESEAAGKLQIATALAEERKQQLDAYDQRFETQREGYEKILGELRDSKATAEATAKLAMGELDSLRGQVLELNRIHGECTGKIAKAETQADERGKEVDRLRSQVETLQGQIGEKTLALAEETRKLQDAEELVRQEMEKRQPLELPEGGQPGAEDKSSKGKTQKPGKE